MTEQKFARRIKLLQEKMQREGIALYLIPMNDDHGSEYIAPHFKQIAYYSGFTGSAGTLVVTEREARLWTDGRYFLQAEAQLQKSGVLLMKMGQKGVPDVIDYIVSFFAKLYEEPEQRGQKLGFYDGIVSAAFIKRLQKRWAASGAASELPVSCGEDPAGQLWAADDAEPRPALRPGRIWALRRQEHGMDTAEKVKLVREKMQETGAQLLVLSALDEIAWLTNLRGEDIAYNPVFYAYMTLTLEEAFLYVQEISPVLTQMLADEGIEVRPYDAFFAELSACDRQTVQTDDKAASHRLLTAVSAVSAGSEPLVRTSPVQLLKAVKNETEISNERHAHVMDGVAVTRFIYWLKTSVRTGREKATEMTAADKLEDLRREAEGYLGQSFAPIIAYREHGAIVHYEADEASDMPLGNESFLLADTGGHYLTGTTDVTRTIAMGQLTAQQKRHYTAVLQGHLHLMDAVCRKGLQGCHLDYLAREPLYRMGLDFGHGTGHGVGYLLNVHEGPNAFHLRANEENVLLPGMITSDEPGVYLAGEYGIRLENLLLCVEREKTEYGQFIGFESLTLAPFEPEALDMTLLTERDRALLNAYHSEVYEKIAPHLSGEERNWLCEQTKPV